jgi:Uma2 family endonuclease
MAAAQSLGQKEEDGMTVITLPAVTGAPSAADRPAVAEQRVVLPGIRWQTYEALLADLGDCRVRLTYDRGRLEIMAPLFRYESYAGVLGRLVEILAEELDLPFKSGWSTTFRRQDLERGLEPDRCFYIGSLASVVGRLEIDLTRDPPPDLAIEIDITHSSLDRLGIYAALGMPEVWRFDGQELQVYHRQADGTYQITSTSPTFPMLPLAEVVPLLHHGVASDDLSQVRTLRAWVRKHVPRNPNP